jgi:hypothetical protein
MCTHRNWHVSELLAWLLWNVEWTLWTVYSRTVIVLRCVILGCMYCMWPCVWHGIVWKQEWTCQCKVITLQAGHLNGLFLTPHFVHVMHVPWDFTFLSVGGAAAEKFLLERWKIDWRFAIQSWYLYFMGFDGICQISFIDYDYYGFGCCRCHELDVIKNFIHISLFNNKTSVFGPQSGSNPLLHYNHINT